MGYRYIAVEAVYIDNMILRCGLFTSDTELNNGYGCKSKSKDKQCPGCCYVFDCPLGPEMDEEDELWEDHMAPGYWILQTREVV